MGKKIGTAVKNAIATIELMEQRLAAWQWICQFMWESTGHTDSIELKYATNVIHNFLYDRMHRAYQALFMWAPFNEIANQEAKKIAFKKFLDDQTSIMQYLNLDHRYPGRWRKEDEEEFRKEIEEEKWIEENDARKREE